MPTEPINWSLEYFRQHGHEITVFCPDAHGSKVDLGKAIALLGPDLTFPEGRQKLLSTWRCPTCRKSGYDLILQPPNHSGTGKVVM